MSIFKKLLGSFSEEKIETCDLPEALPKSESTFHKKNYVRFKDPRYFARAERVELRAWHQLECVSLDPSFEISDKNSVLNISLSGLALNPVCFLKIPKSGDRFQVKISINQKVFNVNLLIAHVSEKVVGASYVDPTLDFIGWVKNYFLVEIAAMRLSAVAPQFLKEVESGIPHWLEGDQKTSIYYVELDGLITQFNLTFFGNTVEYLGTKSLRFGQFQLDADAVNYNSSSRFKWDLVWSETLIDLARRFVETIPELGISERTFFLSIINLIPKV